ncbi:MAG: methyl-accepting chemotaxis protein [Gammaproteobacteria bacterium]
MTRTLTAVAKHTLPSLPLIAALGWARVPIAVWIMAIAAAALLVALVYWRSFKHGSAAEKFGAISDASALASFSMDGRLHEANAAYAQMMGCDADTLPGRAHRTLFAQTAADESAALWEKLQQGEHVACRSEHLRDDGSSVWVQALYCPLLDARGKPYKVLEQITDVTAQICAAAADRQIVRALDRCAAPIVVCESDYRLQYINPSARRLLQDINPGHSRILQALSAAQPGGNVASLLDNDPVRQQQITAALDSDGQMDLATDTHAIRLTANAIEDDNGRRAGIVIDCTDRTQEAQIKQEVHKVVGLARVGELGSRLKTDKHNGFLHGLSDDMNDMLDVSEQIIMDTKRVFSAMAEGQLNQFIDTEFEGSFEHLRQDANATVRRLIGVVSSIKEVAESVRVAAHEIADGNLHLNERTEQQAASLDRTTASMNDLIKAVHTNAQSASEANRLAQEARSEAEKGGVVVKNAVDAMAQINESSSKISDIIRVINDIAFQTNLLALNASVEAARAGEKGLGFAVVASEVRDLAGRSATAAKEIKDLIETSESRVAHGSRLVRESGDVLTSIVQAADSVTHVVGDIATASQEQATGIDAVNQALVKMDSITQRNAALVEQAAAASHDLGERAGQLSGLVEFFQLPSGSVGLKRRRSDQGLPMTAEELQKAAKYQRRKEDRATGAANQRGAA